MNYYNYWIVNLPLPKRTKSKLISEYKTSENIYYALKNGYCDIINYEEIINFFKNDYEDIIKRKINNLIEEGVDLSIISSLNYPKSLLNIKNPPFGLFYKGNIDKLNDKYNVSIVGARKCSYYGRNVTELICKELSINKINIISGLARGIDSIAHESTLNNGGYTCGVLGCGIDMVYPKENKKIYDIMKSRGCIISEFMPGTGPLKDNFPIRNRIISGLSQLVIVIEADERSGSLITASFATDQNRDVMAVPGSIFSNCSRGTNRLLHDGAAVYTEIQDIFDYLKISYVMNSAIDNSKDKFTYLENKIYRVINDSPIHIDDIMKITNIDINRLYEVLFELQLKKHIICLAGNYYVKLYR
ncbi:MAG: uptake protein [Clostridiaceae bacterium]|jgi:DNA processing protein|nr:uptake protein [Clostridiaceae bacterium]